MSILRSRLRSSKVDKWQDSSSGAGDGRVASALSAAAASWTLAHLSVFTGPLETQRRKRGPYPYTSCKQVDWKFKKPRAFSCPDFLLNDFYSIGLWLGWVFWGRNIWTFWQNICVEMYVQYCTEIRIQNFICILLPLFTLVIVSICSRF